MLALIIVIFLVVLVLGGSGYSRYGLVGISPAAVVLLVAVLLYFTGHLSLR